MSSFEKASKEDIWARYFAQQRDPAVLQALRELAAQGSQEASMPTSLEDSERMLSIVDPLAERGVPPFQSLLYQMAHARRPRLGDVLRRYKGLTKDEKIQLLDQFIVEHDEDHAYPCLDLSRQGLDTVPEEIAEAHVPLGQVHGSDGPMGYKEIDLSHNPQLTALTRQDFKRLNHFQGLHFIGSKLTQLPPEIGLLTGVWKLNFSFSKLQALPDELYGLTELRVLALNWTDLRNFSDKISALTKLLWVEVSETSFLHTIYRIGDQGGEARTDAEKAVLKVKGILEGMGCGIEE